MLHPYDTDRIDPTLLLIWVIGLAGLILLAACAGSDNASVKKIPNDPRNEKNLNNSKGADLARQCSEKVAWWKRRHCIGY